MTSSIAPLAEQPETVEPRNATGPATSRTSGPARGIAVGAVLSAPMWIGIVYLLRLLSQSF